jgi:hypothetical protein
MRRIIITCLLITVLQTVLIGGETEVEVLQGKVRGRTSQTEMIISAGKKVLLREGHQPIIAVNDPLVLKAIELYRWVEQERQAGHAVEDATILVAAIDDEQAVRFGILEEKINDGSEAKSVIQLGPMSTFKDVKFYDFEGNLLDFEVKPLTKHSATYSVHLHKPVELGQKIRYITVSQSLEHIYWITQGPTWSTIFANACDSKPTLFLYHIVLPESAILLSAYPTALLTDEIENRIALTFRHFIEDPLNSLSLGISFLWPDKDGTTMDDVTLKMRGIMDPKQARIIQEANRQLARIADGQRFSDLSTPMNSILSFFSLISHDLDKIETPGGDLNLFIKKEFKGNLKYARERCTLYEKYLPYVEVHSYSPLPNEPRQADTAWVKLKHKGVIKPIATVECVYTENYQWLIQGIDIVTPQ